MAFTFRAILLLAAFPGGSVLADWKADIGYTSLQARLGVETPDGTGVDVTHIEAPANTSPPYVYRPNPNAAEFTAPPELAKTFFPECAACDNSTYSGHAYNVGVNLYGNSLSIAPGILQIGVNEVNNWLVGTLRSGFSQNPVVENRRIQNHSWIGADADQGDILRRLDWTINRDGVVVCVATDNSAGAMPTMLSSAYNVLTVGKSNGVSSYGPTVIDAPGRVKPDIVAPGNLPSYATPMVGGATALLLQTMNDAGYLIGQRMPQALTTKAILMAGASKYHPNYALLNTWRKGFATPSTDGTVPLDYRFGAGMLDIDDSHRILTAGEQNASSSSLVTATGWDYVDDSQFPAGATRQYFFEVPAFSYIRQLSVLVTWNRHVTRSGTTTSSTLANINLKLFTASGFTKGSQVDQSISSLDNVEHIFLKNLLGGRYVFEVTTDSSWDYAIAWDVATNPTVQPDLTGEGAVDAADINQFIACQSGPEIGPPPCTRADLDNDNDVDVDDFGLLQRCYAGTGTVAGANCYP